MSRVGGGGGGEKGRGREGGFMGGSYLAVSRKISFGGVGFPPSLHHTTLDTPRIRIFAINTLGSLKIEEFT